MLAQDTLTEHGFRFPNVDGDWVISKVRPNLLGPLGQGRRGPE